MRRVIRPYLGPISYREDLSLTLDNYRRRKERLRRLLFNHRENLFASTVNTTENVILELDQKIRVLEIRYAMITRRAGM